MSTSVTSDEVEDIEAAAPNVMVGTTLMAPMHPGEILKAEFLDPMGKSQSWLAGECELAPQAISEICKCKRSITANVAIRLARVFGVSARFFLSMQADYDLRMAWHKDLECGTTTVGNLPGFAQGWFAVEDEDEERIPVNSKTRKSTR